MGSSTSTSSSTTSSTTWESFWRSSSSPKLKALKDPQAVPQLQHGLLTNNTTISPATKVRQFNWWLKVAVNAILLLVGQTAGTLLGRFYYDQGGASKWLQALTYSAGFPVLYIPLILARSSASASRPPLLKITLAIGLITTADNLMFSCGLLYLSVSTFSLVCATQLAFNAVFSYYINKAKFTHLTLNSVVVLTFSAAIIAVHSESGSSMQTSGGVEYIYMLGFVLTLAASATYSLILSLMELTFEKVIKNRAFYAVLDMQIHTAMAATMAGLAGLFASGEWKELKGDMDGFKKGRVSYMMTIAWTAICWQVMNVAMVGLVFEVSSLFTNFISTLGIPILPLFAVVLFHDRMDGMKVVSLLLGLWGFVSYFYQHYLDYKLDKEKAIAELRDSMEVSAV